MSSSSKSRVVFVGNIPYDMTEEQVIEIFKEVGPVVSFKLVFDRETGKTKGYGFCEFADAETAASAIRNLNNYDVGGRQLRVDKADHEAPSAPTATTTSTGPAVGAAVPNATGSISIEAINDVLGRLSNAQLLEMLTQMKNMATANPEHLRQMLSSNPSMTFAVFQAMVMMNMIDPTIVQQIMSQSQQATPSAHQPPQQQHQQQPHTGNLAAEQQKALIAQIMSLTAEQINALPAGQREQIIQLVLESLLLTNILCVASATRLSTSLILT